MVQVRGRAAATARMRRRESGASAQEKWQARAAPYTGIPRSGRFRSPHNRCQPKGGGGGRSAVGEWGSVLTTRRSGAR